VRQGEGGVQDPLPQQRLQAIPGPAGATRHQRHFQSRGGWFSFYPTLSLQNPNSSKSIPKNRAVDPDSLNRDTDPDPAFQVNPDPGFSDQKLKKKNADEKLFDQNLQFT
jgi:hypothetical protein